MRTAANAAINFRSAKAHSGTASGARPWNCYGRLPAELLRAHAIQVYNYADSSKRGDKLSLR